MGTTTDKLNHIINTKEGIRQEINRAYNAEEISTSDTFSSYIQKLEEHPFYIMRYIERSIESIELPNATSIGNYAFQSCSGLTSVSFPNAKSIGESAFQSCSGLTSVSFPNATSIGEYAFRSCSSLTEASFPKATSIGSDAFKSCSSLISVSFPLVTSISSYAFQDCSGLSSVSFPNATSTGSYAFKSCSSLTSVSIPKAISINGYSFYNCSSLTEVSFPVVTSISNSAFQSCSGLTKISFPNATSIGNSAFSECSGLTSVSFPNATSIGEGAFASCSGLTSVSFPNATSIGLQAFQYCSSLTSVSIPKATSIGDSAFSGSGLTTIYVGTESDTVCTLSHTNAFTNCTNLTNIYVPYSLVDSYKSATNWSSFADKIKADRVPVECISLSITADDVAVGNETSTTVYYTAECTYTKNGILQEGTTVFTGKGISNSFEQNTSTTDTVQRTVSFTFMGKTATTTITQGVWVNRSITVTTEGISKYGWELAPADSEYNIKGYDVYMSNNKGVGKSQAVMKLKCKGYTDLTLYIRSYAESSYDYTIASKVNVSNYPKDYYSSDVKAHTSGKQNSGTTLNDYTKVEYTGLKDNDTIYIVFKKDSSGDKGDDRGYVLIPKA